MSYIKLHRIAPRYASSDCLIAGPCAALALLFAATMPAMAQATDDATQALRQPAITATSARPQDPKPAKEDILTEDEVKQRLLGKTLYLRDGYLDNSLNFDEHGRIIGSSPKGSYTLCLIQVDKVNLSKRHLEITGARYGLHFLGALPNEDPTHASDKVRITPKKKFVKITIDREQVIKPKKEKGKKGDNGPAASAETAAVPADLPPGDANGVTTTTSPAHAAGLLRAAIDTVFASNLDDHMIAAMPSFWKLYYQAVAAHSDFTPSDPSVHRESSVDQKAKLLSAFEPPSNEFAQNCGIVGMALYHVVVGSDGAAQQIVVARPIGFGLDENAADTIRKAKFEPAIKDGKPVPVMLDVVVQFRIYSKRTDRPAQSETDEASASPNLPGPYSVVRP